MTTALPKRTPPTWGAVGPPRQSHLGPILDLDIVQHQVRRWTSWHRWTVLAMLAHAFLSVTTATQPTDDPHSDLIPLTRNESAAHSPPPPQPSSKQPTPCAGPPGDADTRPDPAPATTSDSDKALQSHDHEVRLEYKGVSRPQPPTRSRRADRCGWSGWPIAAMSTA
jgi:hypothetical protein